MIENLTRRSVLKAMGGTSIAAVGGLAFTDTAAGDVPCYDVSVSGIPDNYLATYKDAGAGYDLDWTILAGVGRVETNHGRFEPGCDESGAGARGPMQFMPSTWDAYGVDGNGDGVANICDYRDAIPAAANYLVTLGARQDPHQALCDYYGACQDNYADAVLCIAEQYRNGSAGTSHKNHKSENATGGVLAETDFVWPIGGIVTSPYGSRNGGFHYGIDIDGGDIGEPIYAARGGTAYAKSDPGGYGNYVYIVHGNGYATEYGHVNSFKISNGQTVNTGDLIAGMGSTGNSTGPHLHLSIEHNGEPQPIPANDGATLTAKQPIPKDYSGI